MVFKERTTATAITEGTWGFEHTKACFRDDIIPFVKSLQELFTSFDQFLIDEVAEVQNVFTQMELAIEKHCEEKTKVQIKIENVLQENDRLLTQALSGEIVNIVVHENMKSVCLNVTAYERCRDTWSSQESAPTFAELFKINNFKAQAQEKDTMILKLKEKLNFLNGDVKDRNVKRDIKEIETLNIELDHKVTKLAAENEHLKQTYKQLYDSVKSSCVRSKEQCDDLINKVNLKSTEISDLNASLQEKVLVITALKAQLNKLKVPKLRKNRTAHTDYIRHTQEEAATLREIVERRIFTLVGNVCPLTRIATPTIVPPRDPIPIVNSTDNQSLHWYSPGNLKLRKFLTKWNPTTLGDPQVLMFLLHFLPA
nr:hypothetical protein [Tanacetum cinerariifolium]